MRAVLALAAFLLTASAQPVTYTIAGNMIEFHARDGSAEFEWLDSSSFRFKRDWHPSGGPQIPRTAEKVAFETKEAGTHVVFTSRDLTVDIDRATLRVVVSFGENPTPIDLGVIRRAPGKIVLERPLPNSETIYGLGASSGKTLDIRGQRITGGPGTLLSSAGYGVWYRTPARYVYDAGANDPLRFRVVLQGASALEQFFFYGPTPKEILEMRRRQMPARELPADYLRVLPESELPASATVLTPPANPCDLASLLTHTAMSGVLYPALEADRLPAPLAPLVPLLYTASSAAPSPVNQRRAWTPYLIAYLREAYDRGFPLIRPFAMQFPRDPDLAGIADVFMIGDELLIAPPCDGAGRRTFKLPRGIWTDLRDNRMYPGRKEASFEAPAANWPVLARNGTIVPIDNSAVIELHYFPQLGAEFFLYEPAIGEHSQFHASPAGDYWRLEAETKVRRKYEWIVHHVDRPRHLERAGIALDAVATRAEMRPSTWFYDAPQRNLHVLIDALAYSDDIVNIRF